MSGERLLSRMKKNLSNLTTKIGKDQGREEYTGHKGRRKRPLPASTLPPLSRVGFLERCPKKPPGKPQDTMYLLMLLQQLGRPVHPKNLPLKALPPPLRGRLPFFCC